MKLLPFFLGDPKISQCLFGQGAVTVPCLHKHDLDLLLADVSDLILTLTDEEVGPHRVRQRFEFSEHTFGSTSPFTILRYALEERVKESWHFFDEFRGFNEVRVQRYPPGDGGIGIHRDNARFKNLVIVIILEGDGEFSLYSGRNGEGKRVLPTNPGDAIIMRAPGFMSMEDAPLHSVENIKSERVVITFRDDSHLPAGQP